MVVFFFFTYLHLNIVSREKHLQSQKSFKSCGGADININDMEENNPFWCFSNYQCYKTLEFKIVLIVLPNEI